MNVLVAAVASAGPAASFEAWPSPPPTTGNPPAETVGILNDGREFLLYLSPHILGAVAAVLSSDFGWASEEIERYLASLVEVAFDSGGGVMDPTTRVADCEDWEDNRILELAVDAGALLIVSSDRHLLEMSPRRGIPIMPPSDFVARVDAMRRAARRE